MYVCLTKFIMLEFLQLKQLREQYPCLASLHVSVLANSADCACR